MEQTDNSNHKSIRVEVEVRTETTIKEIIRIGTDQITGQIAETEDNVDKTEVCLGLSKILGGNFRGNVRNYSRGEYRNSHRNDSYDRSRNRSRERSFSRNYGNIRTRSTSQNRSRSESRASTKWDKICCYKCREYDHLQGTVQLLEKKMKLNSFN